MCTKDVRLLTYIRQFIILFLNKDNGLPIFFMLARSPNVYHALSRLLLRDNLLFSYPAADPRAYYV